MQIRYEIMKMNMSITTTVLLLSYRDSDRDPAWNIISGHASFYSPGSLASVSSSLLRSSLLNDAFTVSTLVLVLSHMVPLHTSWSWS
jgi:hypothetical protein